MATKNKAVEIVGSEARLASIQIFPQQDGNVVIVSVGAAKDSDGRPVALKDAQSVYAPGENDAMDDLLAGALASLRKANGLEDGEISFEPVADVNAALVAMRAEQALPAPAEVPAAPAEELADF